MIKALARSYVYWPNMNKCSNCQMCYFIHVDAYSKWTETFQMSRITADETILKLKQIFSQFGITQLLVSNNGSAFTSATFFKFQCI